MKIVPSLVLLCALTTAIFIADAKTPTPTPLPKALKPYQKKVFDAIGRVWYAGVQKNQDLLKIGKVQTTFTINPEGRVTNLKIVSNTSNEVLANICIQSIKEPKFPPLPKEVLRETGGHGLDVDLPFVIYGN